MYRVRGADQNVYGPIAAETVRQWIAERRLNRDSQVCREGEEVWQSLGALAEFADALGPVGGAGGGLGMSPSPSAVPGLPTGVGSHHMSELDREAVISETKPAAISLIVFGAVMLLLGLVNLVTTAIGITKPGSQELPPDAPDALKQMMKFQTDMPAAIQYGLIGVSLVVFTLVVIGGVRMLQLRARGLVMTAAILVMIPCFTSCCCILGLPLGIWVIVLINKPEVQRQFE